MEKGGGRPDFAQGAGSTIAFDLEAIQAAVQAAKQRVLEQLN